MSIVKNNTSYDSVDYTIKRLSTVPNSQGVELPIIQYTHLTKAYFSVAVAKAGIILIRARIPSTATGYLFGYRGANDSASDNIFIRVEEQSGSKVVVWNLGGTTIGSVPLDSDHFHEYGFVGGYAIYDYQKVNGSQSTPSVSGFTMANVCGAKSNGANVAISEVYIARLDIHSFLAQEPETYETPYLCRFYPTTGNDGYMYNAMRLVYANIHPTTLSGGSTEGGPVLTEPYGIQLDDIRYLTRLGYIDALALICADGGVDARAGQTQPESAYSEITGHYFAFDLSNTPTPSGPTPPPTYSYLEGKLRAGRKPNWDIWNDCIARGFYVRNDNGTYKLEFNIFKLADGSWDKVIRLDMFNGYNTAESAIHPPTFTLSSPKTEIEFHNGANYRCASDSFIIPYQDNYGTFLDSCMLFDVQNVADLDYNVKLGNAIPWNIPQANLGEYYGIIGGGVAITISNDVYAKTYKKESTIMCADQPSDSAAREALKTYYRETGTEGKLLMNYLITSLRNMFLSVNANIDEYDTYSDFPSSGTADVVYIDLSSGRAYKWDSDESDYVLTDSPYTINAKAEIALTAINNITIRMPDLTGLKDVILNGVFNTTIDEEASTETTMTHRRQFVGEHLTKDGSAAKYMAYAKNPELGAYMGYSIPYFQWRRSEYSSDRKCMVMATQECNSSNQLIEDSTSLFYAYIIIEQSDSNHPNEMVGRACCLVKGISINPYANPCPYAQHSLKRVAWSWARMQVTSPTSWYSKMGEIGGGPVSTYSNFFVADRFFFDYSVDLDHSDFEHFDYSNIRYDIYRADLVPVLAKYDGTWMTKCDSHAWVAASSLVKNTTPVFIHRLPDEIFTNRGNVICNTFMRKYVNSNNNPDISDTSGWVEVIEGYGTMPSFAGTIVVEKMDTVVEYASYDNFPSTGQSGIVYVSLAVGYTYIWGTNGYERYNGNDANYVHYTKVAEFSYSGSEQWSGPSPIGDNPQPRQYTQANQNNNSYICKLSFREDAAPFNNPNGSADTLNTDGYLWYYAIEIDAPSSLSGGETFKISFKENS